MVLHGISASWCRIDLPGDCEAHAEVGRVDIIRLLLELGADPNVDLVGGKSNAEGNPPADEGEDQERPSDSNKAAASGEAEGDSKQSSDADVETSGGDNDVSKPNKGSSQGEDGADVASIDVVMSDSNDFNAHRCPHYILP